MISIVRIHGGSGNVKRQTAKFRKIFERKKKAEKRPKSILENCVPCQCDQIGPFIGLWATL